MIDTDDIIDPQRVVKSLHVKTGGLFSPGGVDVEYEDVKYKFVDKAKRTIVCNACQGAGKKPGQYHGWMGDDMRTCAFCDGAGTLKLKAPKKTV
jgi:hypothetical protein